MYDRLTIFLLPIRRQLKASDPIWQRLGLKNNEVVDSMNYDVLILVHVPIFDFSFFNHKCFTNTINIFATTIPICYNSINPLCTILSKVCMIITILNKVPIELC